MLILKICREAQMILNFIQCPASANVQSKFQNSSIYSVELTSVSAFTESVRRLRQGALQS